MQFRILFQDPWFVAIDKPAGFFVHPPEDRSIRVPRGQNCLFLLRKQLDRYLYPIHRLDRATSGVLLFGLDQDAAKRLYADFSERRVTKRYVCVVRGWLPTDTGAIERALRPKDRPEDPAVEAVTHYEVVHRIELPIPNERYATSRYTLCYAEPKTGRMHQIRRHFNGLGHPLVGDTVYGDREHNRIFRERLGIEGLLLKAQELDVAHPVTGEPLRIRSRWNERWHRAFEVFGVCAWTA